MNRSHLGEGLSAISRPQEDEEKTRKGNKQNEIERKWQQYKTKQNKKQTKTTQQPSAPTEGQTHEVEHEVEVRRACAVD